MFERKWARKGQPLQIKGPAQHHDAPKLTELWVKRMPSLPSATALILHRIIIVLCDQPSKIASLTFGESRAFLGCAVNNGISVHCLFTGDVCSTCNVWQSFTIPLSLLTEIDGNELTEIKLIEVHYIMTSVFKISWSDTIYSLCKSRGIWTIYYKYYARIKQSLTNIGI